MTDFRVAINISPVSGGEFGGVEQFLIGLTGSLSELNDNIQYVLTTNPRDPRWIETYINDDMQIVPRPLSGWKDHLRSLFGPYASTVENFVEPALKPLLSHSSFSVPEANGFFSSLDVDLVHFPTQEYQITNIKTVYNPHDLQHEHYPEFFSEYDLDVRKTMYSTACSLAEAIDVPSRFVKDDVVQQYDINPESIYVVPRGPPTNLYDPVSEEDTKRISHKFSLPNQFGFYPAQTWGHKNHISLLRAAAFLREKQGIRVNLVFTGKQNSHFKKIKKVVNELDLEDQVQFLGFVSTTELRALYRLSTYVVIPSLFEGGGFPLLEAWSEGSPVICAEATALPEKAGNAALFFDPSSVESIADSLKRIITETDLRRSLQRRGRERLQLFDWRRTAKIYRAIYREMIGETLSTQDIKLLEAAKDGHMDKFTEI